MAIVKTIYLEHATVHIADDDYRDESPETISRRIQTMLDLTGEALYHIQQREKQKEENRA